MVSISGTASRPVRLERPVGRFSAARPSILLAHLYATIASATIDWRRNAREDSSPGF
jgi:hypothetical protein